jgi:hypothetical protein
MRGDVTATTAAGNPGNGAHKPTASRGENPRKIHAKRARLINQMLYRLGFVENTGTLALDKRPPPLTD